VELDGVEDLSSGDKLAVKFRRAGKPVTISVDRAGPAVRID
jgi:hypothetical protein